jgi:hypothetical protein
MEWKSLQPKKGFERERRKQGRTMKEKKRGRDANNTRSVGKEVVAKQEEVGR